MDQDGCIRRTVTFEVGEIAQRELAKMHAIDQRQIDRTATEFRRQIMGSEVRIARHGNDTAARARFHRQLKISMPIASVPGPASAIDVPLNTPIST